MANEGAEELFQQASGLGEVGKQMASLLGGGGLKQLHKWSISLLQGFEG